MSNSIYTRTLQSLEHIIQNLGSGGLSAHVRGQVLALIQVAVDSGVDLSRGVLLAQELEHQGNTAQSSNGVGNVLALNVGGATVAGLTDGKTVTNVGAGNETQAADESGGTIRQDVSVEVRGNNHIVVLGLAEELVDHGVDDLLLDLDGGKLLGGEGSAGGLAEETVGLGEDVGLVSDGDHGLGAETGGRGGIADLLSAKGNFTGNGSDAGRGALGDLLDGPGDLAIGGLLGALFLHVEILGVLADNDEVDGVTGAAAECSLNGADIGEEVKLLAEGDDGGRVASDLGGWRADKIASDVSLCFQLGGIQRT